MICLALRENYNLVQVANLDTCKSMALTINCDVERTVLFGNKVKELVQLSVLVTVFLSSAELRERIQLFFFLRFMHA